MPTTTEFTPDVTIRAARRAMAKAFVEAGIDTPDLDARLLLAAALGLDGAALVMRGDEPLGGEAGRLAKMTSRRLDREPVSRILGSREFYGRTFALSPATLDPRPDSETVIEAVLSYVDANGGRGRRWRILDVGTGSGCLLVTLLAELPAATGVGTDISDAALIVASTNASANDIGDRAEFVMRRSLDGIAPGFDILISNPPYVAAGEIAGLAPEVRNFDPVAALDGGDDGLVVYREIALRAAEVVPDGFICVEVGATQAPAVTALLREAAGSEASHRFGTVLDLAGHTRCVTQTTRR